MKYSELKRILKDDGWYVARNGSKHDVYHHKEKEGVVVVGRHDSQEVASGTLNSILKQAGLK
ncbi:MULTISPECIES: type II toxin-antitoxin system HicA family toxin [Sphingobacterium]|uniref:type II toxin-antitoxin system HicA family toxin n=1 Tax=Sphingobacterium TaxID=28453 RepID=UPI0025809E5E|nr:MULTISPECIES: type II toxin-antitoxin system HicA family toxin [Sphingobacterium]